MDNAIIQPTKHSARQLYQETIQTPKNQYEHKPKAIDNRNTTCLNIVNIILFVIKILEPL